jgi:hypothetical protein
MAEPQPSTVQEGDTTESTPGTGAAEDRKAAAAMSSLDAPGEDDSTTTTKKEIDTKALGDAMQRLDVGAKGDTTQKERTDKAAAEKKAVVVKVDAADVNLLVRITYESCVDVCGLD